MSTFQINKFEFVRVLDESLSGEINFPATVTIRPDCLIIDVLPEHLRGFAKAQTHYLKVYPQVRPNIINGKVVKPAQEMLPHLSSYQQLYSYRALHWVMRRGLQFSFFGQRDPIHLSCWNEDMAERLCRILRGVEIAREEGGFRVFQDVDSKLLSSYMNEDAKLLYTAAINGSQLDFWYNPLFSALALNPAGVTALGKATELSNRERFVYPLMLGPILKMIHLHIDLYTDKIRRALNETDPHADLIAMHYRYMSLVRLNERAKLIDSLSKPLVMPRIMPNQWDYSGPEKQFVVLEHVPVKREYDSWKSDQPRALSDMIEDRIHVNQLGEELEFVEDHLPVTKNKPFRGLRKRISAKLRQWHLKK